MEEGGSGGGGSWVIDWVIGFARVSLWIWVWVCGCEGRLVAGVVVGVSMGGGYRVSGTGCRWYRPIYVFVFFHRFSLISFSSHSIWAPFLSLVYPKSFSFDLPYPVLLISRLHPSLLQYLRPFNFISTSLIPFSTVFQTPIIPI